MILVEQRVQTAEVATLNKFYHKQAPPFKSEDYHRKDGDVGHELTGHCDEFTPCGAERPRVCTPDEQYFHWHNCKKATEGV